MYFVKLNINLHVHPNQKSNISHHAALSVSVDLNKQSMFRVKKDDESSTFH